MSSIILSILLMIPMYGWAKLTDVNYNKAIECLGKRESNNDYEVVNTLGYMGRWQFGAAALEDIGYVKKGCYKKYKNKAPKQCWTGKSGAFSKRGFLTNETAQDKAIELFFDLNYNKLINNKVLTKDSTQTKKAQALFVSHLLGVQSAKSYFEENDNETDAYGASAKEYAELAKECLK